MAGNESDGSPEPPAARRRFAKREIGEAAAVRGLLFALLWLALAGTEPGAVLGGAVIVAAAVVVSFRLQSPARGWPLRARALLLLPLFLWESITAGVDVAYRVLHRDVPLDPAALQHRLRSESGPVPIALAYLVSALPGTLVTAWNDGWMRIYTIDKHQEGLAAIAALELRLAWALAPESHPGHSNGD